MSGDSCPYATMDIKAKTMKGCALTEVSSKLQKEGIFKKSYYPCPESCFKGPYERCPIYMESGGREK